MIYLTDEQFKQYDKLITKFCDKVDKLVVSAIKLGEAWLEVKETAKKIPDVKVEVKPHTDSCTRASGHELDRNGNCIHCGYIS